MWRQWYSECRACFIRSKRTTELVTSTIFDDISLDLKLKEIPTGTIKRVGAEDVKVVASSSLESVYFIEMPKEYIKSTTTPITIMLYNGEVLIDEIQTNFLGPSPKRSKR
jgi:hypothetical protein